jgi:hypothetical protein
LDDRFCHLTNTAVNVTNTQNAGPILELARMVLRRIIDIVPQSQGLWDHIRQAVLLSIVAMYPGILQNVGMVVPEPRPIRLNPMPRPISEVHRYFHLVGIDIMLNDRCEPVVLEVNDRPSMCVTYPIEDDLKTRVVFDALNLVLADLQNEGQQPVLGGWEPLLPISEDSAFGSAVQSIVERSSQALTTPTKIVVKRISHVPSTAYARGRKRMATSLPLLHQ